MELKDLSSNWKKLRQSLKKEETENRLKRKASEEILQPRHNGAKRSRDNRKSSKLPIALQEISTKSQSMGLGASKPTRAAPSASLALWAEDNDIPARDLAAAYGPSLMSTSIPPTKNGSESINAGISPNVEAGKYVAIDCEMVGVGPTPDHDSALARVSLVNYHGEQLYDSFVLPKEAVTDFRTHVSGITPSLLKSARSFEEVQRDVAGLTQDKILVGHAIRNDLEALMLGHPRKDIRDTSRYPGYRKLAGGRTPALKRLAKELLGVEIQGGEHSSIEDARATMLLFRREKEGFEKEHAKRWGTARKADGTTKNAKDSGTEKRQKKKRVRK
ncbi:3'-5' exonuclease [Xylographa carneopallida]|nr:3'-5' exonuclease [Xylographa carneopallida]